MRENGASISDTKVSNRRQTGVNLLSIGFINRLYTSKAFPATFQVLLLVVFLFLIVTGWNLYTPDGVADKLYAKTNIVNLLIWGLWWPAMVWVAVIFGRAWCAVCPLEFVSTTTEKLARRLRVPQAKLGKWLRSGALILVLYFVIQMLVASMHLHRVPMYTAVFLLVLLGTAAITGFFIKDRAFCRGFCPVGLLLSTYGKGSVLSVRPVEKPEAQQVISPESLTKNHLAYSCPSLLNPARIQKSSDCLLCGQCIKADKEHKTMGLFLQPFFSRINFRESSVSWIATLFMVMLSGFVFYELCTEWKAAKTAFLEVPTYLASLIGYDSLPGWIKGIWTLIVFPSVVWVLLGSIVRLTRGADSIRESWSALAIPMAILMSGGHMAKGLAKVSSWGGYLPFAIEQPDGVNIARAMTLGDIANPAHLFSGEVVSVVAFILIGELALFSVRELRLSNPGKYKPYMAPVILVALVELFLVWGWGFA